jgi:RNA-binding protein 25
MDEMQALAEEQRKAGMLLDDGKVVRLNVSLQPTKDKDTKDKDGGETSASTPTGTAAHTRTGTPSHPSSTFTASKPAGPVPSKVVFSTEDDEEEALTKKRKVPLVKLDFSVEESPDKTRERLERIRESTPKDREELFKGRVRWDGLSDVSNPPLPQLLLFMPLSDSTLTTYLAANDRSQIRTPRQTVDEEVPRRYGRR